MAITKSVLLRNALRCERYMTWYIVSQMNRTVLLRIFVGVVFLASAWIAHTQNQGQVPQLKVNKVKEDLYEIEGDGGNVAVYATSEGLILVDDKFDRDHDAILSQIKTFSNQPVKYILSTHYHEDHS